MAIKADLAEELAARGGKPIRGADHPLPLLFPRSIAPEARANIDRVLDSGFTLAIVEKVASAYRA